MAYSSGSIVLPTLKTQVFTIVAPVTGPRSDNWGVCRCVIAGQRVTIPIKGTWPCQASLLLPGQAFRAQLSESFYEGRRQLNARPGIAPVKAKEFAVMQQMVTYDGGRYRRSIGTLVKNMSRADPGDTERALTRTFDALMSPPPPLGSTDPLTAAAEGNLRAATAKSLRDAFRAVAPRVSLQARFSSLSADMVSKLPIEICERVIADPYLLCTYLAEEFGRERLLKAADRIALAEGLDATCDSRVVQHLVYAVEHCTTLSGSFWASVDSVLSGARKTLSEVHPSPGANYGEACSRAFELPAFQSVVVSEGKGSARQIALVGYDRVERALADQLGALSARDARGSPYPKAQALFEALLAEGASPPGEALAAVKEAVDRVRDDAAQVAALRCLLSHWLAVVHGSAGCGKTDVIKTFVLLVQAGGDREIWCVAPTGRAASNLEHRCASLKGKVATIHSRLNPSRLSQAPQGGAVCLEEASMANAGLVHSFLQMYKQPIGPLAVFGDDHQLPAIGPMGGALLRDLIECPWVPSVELLTIHRQGPGNSICTSAGHILNGARPEERPYVSGDPSAEGPTATSGWHMQLVESHRVVARAIERVRALHASAPHQRVQMLACCNSSCEAANEALQDLYNPAADSKREAVRPPGRKPAKWREGDRVVHLTNLYDPLTKERLLANGDTGTIVAVNTSPKAVGFALTVAFPRADGSSYTHEYASNGTANEELLHAYCLTTHRAQGSEFDHVVSAIENNAGFLSKELAYTSVTRGRENVTLVTSEERLQQLLRRSVRDARVTRLTERLAATRSRKRARDVGEWLTSAGADGEPAESEDSD